MHPEEEPVPGHSTGPRTEAGKAVSSMNRLTHGCRSEQVILRHEDPAQYTALVESWFHQYNPQTPAERLLVDQTAHAQWFLMRAQRRFDEVDYDKNVYFRHWTESQNHEYALALRYKTAAERAFLRWFKELESFCARVQRKQRMAVQTKTAEKPPEPKPGPSIYPGILPNFPAPTEFFFPSESPPRPRESS
jgi:hypothetical protein